MKKKIKTVANLDIHLDQSLGEGAYGIVYKGMFTDPQKKQPQEVAIKCLSKNIVGKDQYSFNALKNQILILARIKSPHVVSFKTIAKTARNFYIAQELCEGDLQKYLQKNGRLSQKQAIGIFQQILLGFYELIVRGVVHRDLKPQNILYKDKIFKICDFGMAICKNSKDDLIKTKLGSQLYQSPQQRFGDKYTYKCDIWSLGCVFFELLFSKKYIKFIGEVPSNPKNYQFKIPQFPQISPQCKSLLQMCLQHSEQHRADWPDIFDNPLFQKRLPSIKSLNQKMKYIMTTIRNHVQHQNINLQAFFDKFKKDQKIDLLSLKDFSRLLLCLVPNLSAAEINYIFWNFDEDGDKKISIHEFENIVKEHSNYISVKPQQIFGQIKNKEEKQILQVYDKFINAAFEDKLNSLHEKFVIMDTQNKGLDRKMFSELCLSLCSDLTDNQLELLFKKFDQDQNQLISYAQFYKHLCKVIGMTPRSIIRQI